MDANESLDCRRAAWLLSLARERELDAAEKAALRHHLDECLGCRNYEQQLRFLSEAAGRFGL